MSIGHTAKKWAATLVAAGVGAAFVAPPTQAAATPEAPLAPVATSIVINEVESNGDDTDWVEVMNIGDDAVDLSGFTMMDNKDRDAYTLPQGSVVAPGAVFVIDQKTTTAQGFDFGLGNPDHVRLIAADGETPVADFAYDAHASVTWARCPNGIGDFVDSTFSTKGMPNDCSTPIRINEVASSGEPEDWIELINISKSAVDVTGLVLRDNKDEDVFTIPETPVLAAGAIVMFGKLKNSPLGFDYGLGGDDNVRLFEADGVTLIDSYEWSEHAVTTYGRCPDGTGEFTTTTAPTPGEPNICAGIINAQPWPGGADVSTVDTVDTYAGDMSGVDFDPTTEALWAVQNGDGLLYRIVADANGDWAPDTADGWEDGKTLRYPDGTGTVDAEGVTVTDSQAADAIYVSSERNNDSSSTSRPSVLKYDVSGTGDELTASAEWNLAEDSPGLGANAGLEGVTYVPDSFLVANGFIDQATGSAYAPADYIGHGDGLFFVGVEGTAGVYAYALMADGRSERVAELDMTGLGFSNVADVQFDADRAALWVVCDEVCDGRIATFTLSGDGEDAGVFTASALYERPAGMTNVANEGFTITDASTCVDGSVATFYVDDANTDGFSIRTGTLDCVGGSPVEPVDPVDPDPTDPTDPTDPEETDPDGPTNPEVPGGDDSTDDEGTIAPGAPLGCSVSAPSTATAGKSINVTVDPTCTGDEVVVVMYSEPTVIGTFAVAADGRVEFTIPVDLTSGTHIIELRLADGTVVGSTSIVLVTPVEVGAPVNNAPGELSDTGPTVYGTVLLSAVLLMAGAGLAIWRRRTSVR